MRRHAARLSSAHLRVDRPAGEFGPLPAPFFRGGEMRRFFLGGFLLLLCGLPDLQAQIVRPTRYIGSMREVRDHLKTAKFPRTVVVATDGTGDFTTYAAAVTYVTAQTPGAGTPWRIILASGTVNLVTTPLPAFTTLWTSSGIFGEDSSLSIGAAVALAAETTLTLSGLTSTTVGASAVATNIRGLPRFPDAHGLTAALPATCTVSQLFLDTTGAAEKICLCTAANTWKCAALS